MRAGRGLIALRTSHTGQTRPPGPRGASVPEASLAPQAAVLVWTAGKASMVIEPIFNNLLYNSRPYGACVRGLVGPHAHDKLVTTKLTGIASPVPWTPL